MLRAVAAAALAVVACGCFNPTLLGTHCDAQGGCPSPYACNANHVCLLAGPGGSGGAGGLGDPCPFSGAGAGGSSATAGSWSATGSVPTGSGVPILVTYGNVDTNPAILDVQSDATVAIFLRVTPSVADFQLAEDVPGTNNGVTAAPLAYPQGGTSLVVGTNIGVSMLVEAAANSYQRLETETIDVRALSTGFFHGGGLTLYEDVAAAAGTDLYMWTGDNMATRATDYTERMFTVPTPIVAMASGRFHADVNASDPEDLVLTYMTGNQWSLVPGSTSGLKTLDQATIATVMAATAQPWTLTTLRRADKGKPDMVAVTSVNDENITIVAPSTVTQGDGSWPAQSRRLGGGVISVAFGHVLCGASPALVLALQTGEIWLLPTDDGGLCSLSDQAPIKIPGQGPADFVATAPITNSTGPDDILVHKIGDDHVTVLTMTGCN
jgi:hypothetical protein